MEYIVNTLQQHGLNPTRLGREWVLNGKTNPLTDEHYRRIAALSATEIMLENTAVTQPSWMMSNKIALMARPLLRWPIAKVGDLAKLVALLLALSGFVGTASAQEPVKIATVDLLRVFDNYWKTKLSNDQLKERRADFDKARVGMIDDLNLLKEDYTKLNASSQDPANSDETRSGDLKKAQEKLIEYKRLEQQIIDFFVCCCITDMKFLVLPFEAATVITLKIYNGKDSRFHSYEDAWVLLEK